jgi:hypothetical protein
LKVDIRKEDGTNDKLLQMGHVGKKMDVNETKTVQREVAMAEQEVGTRRIEDAEREGGLAECESLNVSS